MKRLLRSRLFTACVASTVTALVVGGVAWAVQSPVDGNGVVHACYNANSGDVQLNVTGNCPAKGRTKPITWNVRGPQGLQGPPGPAGGVAIGDYCDTAIRVARNLGDWPLACEPFVSHMTGTTTIDVTNDADASNTFTVGDTVTFTITATNTGPGSNKNLSVFWQTAGGTNLPGVTTTAGIIQNPTQVIVSSVAPGQVVTITQLMRVDAPTQLSGVPGLFVSGTAWIDGLHGPTTQATDPSPPPSGCGDSGYSCLPLGSPV
jgi:uncharacterized repeat protein (TIGR01451 family)